MALTERPTFSGAAKKTFQKIAIEEAISTHVFNATATLPPVNSTAELPYVDTKYVADVKDRLTNVEARVKAMDEAGVALTVVSLTMPGIEGIFDTTVAVETARKVNNEIRELYTAGPYAERFRAFGCVAMQDPKAAAAEAERCIKEQTRFRERHSFSIGNGNGSFTPSCNAPSFQGASLALDGDGPTPSNFCLPILRRFCR